MRPLPLLALAAFLFTSPSALAAAGVKVTKVSGDVRSRAPKAADYVPVRSGSELPHGTRIRTAKDGQATLRFQDGTEARVNASSEIVVRVPDQAEEPSGVVMFFGRVWTKVVKSVSGDQSFEVRSANAVAGVRGTEFEVGVADDGSTRVVVTHGAVGVAGDSKDRAVEVSAGFEIESDGAGDLAKRKKAPKDPNWEGWFSERARALEKRGVKVAKDLEGRLNRRKAKVEALVKEQRGLRQDIERLEAQKKRGANVEGQLQDKLTRLERVTERLEDMKERLQAAFGMFERWGQIAERGGIQSSDELGRLSGSVARIAADFADMIEEGTDLSPEGMEDMMNEMPNKKTLEPKDSAADELFE